MTVRAPKHKRCSEDDVGRDRLSEMPDEIIVHILSFMTTFHAVRTMLLRRFGNLWTLVPTLEVYLLEVMPGYWRRMNVGQISRFIRNVMKLRKRVPFDKFRLYVDFSCCNDEANLYLQFALDRDAKEIIIGDLSDDPNFYLPDLTSRSLVKLELCHCIIEPEIIVNLVSLKNLTLERVEMCEDAFPQLLSGCPSLQELRIEDPFGIDMLSFTAPNIKKLSLVFEMGYDRTSPLLLDFPNLESLVFDVDLIPEIIDVTSLRDVHVKRLLDYDVGEDTVFKVFWTKFENVEVFRLSHLTSEPLFHTFDYLHLPQIRWKHVTLELGLYCETCLVGFYELMRGLKYLEELIIYTVQYETVEAILPEISYKGVIPQLKTVTLYQTVYRTKPWNRQLQLVEFLLKSAVVLEKLVVVFKKHHRLTEVEKHEFVKCVSTFERASPSAEVHFV